MPVVGHLDRLDALVSELADIAADRDASARGARLLLDDETGDALVGAHGQRDQSRALTVRHPHLRAGDDELVAVANGTACDVAGVAPRVALGQRETAADLAGRESR